MSDCDHIVGLMYTGEPGDNGANLWHESQLDGFFKQADEPFVFCPTCGAKLELQSA